jgi:hypothetical protein
MRKKKLQITGQRNVVQLVNKVIAAPNIAKKIKLSLNTSETNKPIPYTADEALELFIQNGLTKQQYINIRLSAIKK